MHIYYQYVLLIDFCVSLHVLLSFMSLLVKHRSLWQFTRTCLRALGSQFNQVCRVLCVSGILQNKKAFVKLY